MCLAIPAKIVKIVNDETLLVDFGGVQREIKSTLLNEKVGLNDYVLVHIGYAMAKVEEEEALETLRILAEIEEYNQNTEVFTPEAKQ
ncbi:MAG: HypC/HybG/HupF family hydrogenase formation chaperone [Asgard group archaeon]|nr:HypC/HybG/HupF family hydrogenase formation chaperone [Asgard group archaeon]